jgi:hypothetical protein
MAGERVRIRRPASSFSDPINALGYLFLGTTVPGSPGTTFPWFDPTPDMLGCRR